ncbi:MAG TPA: hypothetical protein VHM90_02140 [Phycisphaerae bacterium]|jgi:hypothetical protein|nr:hypothetical protein [Phycisphaerae bacterium]
MTETTIDWPSLKHEKGDVPWAAEGIDPVNEDEFEAFIERYNARLMGENATGSGDEQEDARAAAARNTKNAAAAEPLESASQ